MKKLNLNLLLLVSILSLVLIITSCKSAPASMADDGITIQSGDGWLNDSTYQMTVAGGWDRDRYYIEGEEEKQDGKQPKSIFLLRQLSKTAAKTIAIRNFKQKMISSVVSDSKIVDNVVLKDTIINSLSGISIAPEAKEETYSERGDAEIKFQFKAENLRTNVEKAINDTVSRYKESGEQ